MHIIIKQTSLRAHLAHKQHLKARRECDQCELYMYVSCQVFVSKLLAPQSCTRVHCTRGFPKRSTRTKCPQKRNCEPQRTCLYKLLALHRAQCGSVAVLHDSHGMQAVQCTQVAQYMSGQTVRAPSGGWVRKPAPGTGGRCDAAASLTLRHYIFLVIQILHKYIYFK